MPNQCDVLVIGAGTAGIPCAIAAADAGARVVLVDKRDVAGGMLFVSGGQMSGSGTRLQAAAGIADSPDDHRADVMRISHGLAREDLVRVSVGLQGPMIDWLQDIGFDFFDPAPQFAFGHETYRTARTYRGKDWGRSLLRLFQRELAKRVDSGAIEFRHLTPAHSLLVEDGAVVGARMAPVGGALYDIRAGSVVLATGGFAANHARVDANAPENERGFLCAALEYATGDGLALGESVGAGATPYIGSLPSIALIPDPDRPGFTLFWHLAHIVLPPQVRVPHEIWVNRGGERFIEEDNLSPEQRERALLAQPDHFMAVVFDDRTLDAAKPVLESDALDWTPDRVRLESTRGKFIHRAQSLRELAGTLGVDAAGLERTVARYNGFVAAGSDADFGRSILPMPIAHPPYYGIPSVAGNMLTREGLTVDTDLRVTRPDGSPIRGLFAAGEVLGASQLMGDSFVSGMSVGPAIAMGRWLGERLAGR